MLRVVLDTNVFVSAVIAKGKPRELLIKGMEKRFQIVTSEFILRELARVHAPQLDHPCLGDRWGGTDGSNL